MIPYILMNYESMLHYLKEAMSSVRLIKAALVPSLFITGLSKEGVHVAHCTFRHLELQAQV